MKALALAIGIADAPRLAYLAGAVNAARDFQAWSSAQGYTTRLLTDEDQPVTIPRLEQELRTILQGAPCDRFLLYFAGHGLIREMEEALWLLSDWETGLRAVAVEVLKRRLYQYGIRQIGIIADACQSLPADVQAADLTADGVLGKGPLAAVTVDVDKFTATQDGRQAYALPGATPEEDRCLFSGVLLEGLWGQQPSAFSITRADQVTSSSLGRYLRTEVPKRAAQYGLTLAPTVTPTFAEGEDVYFARDPNRPPPTLPPWPTPQGPVPYLGGVRKLGPAVSARLKAGRPADGAAAPSPAVDFAQRLRDQKRPTHFETGAGFAIDGDRVKGIWAPPDVFAEVQGEPNWWRVGERSGFQLSQPVSLLLELASGHFGAVTALPQFISSIQADVTGITAIIYRKVFERDAAASAENVLARLEQGHLRVTEVAEWTVLLRQEKHADPVLGVVSAYLYDAIGDVDNIRRMAYYYVRHDQPIPYDIALLGGLRGRRDGNRLHVTVPPIPAGKPRTDEERRFEWTHNDTPEVQGIVGGCWPWMRQGWAYLDHPAEDGSNLILPGVLEARPHLTSARFATFTLAGAQILGRAFSLSPRSGS